MKTRFALKTEEWIDDPDRKRRFNVALFDEVADKYSFATRALSLGRDAAWKKALIGRLPELPSPFCLDLASGTGDLALALAERYPTGQILGLDICETMLTHARRRACGGTVRFLMSDMCHTGLHNGSVDIVTGGYALRNAPSLPAVLDEVRRVLRPGGTAAFLEFSKAPQRWRQRLEHLTLVTWGGVWGLILHGNPEIYAYIAKSLERFPDREELRQMIATRGFQDVRSCPLLLGTLELLTFTAPPTNDFKPG